MVAVAALGSPVLPEITLMVVDFDLFTAQIQPFSPFYFKKFQYTE